ncbi:MAG: polysaccharide deacetylase family protein [Pseudomonadota bacterium]
MQINDQDGIGRRALILATLSASAGAVLPSWAFAARGNAVPILAYHRFDRARPGSTTVTIPTLTSQLRQLVEHDYRVVALRDAIAALRQRRPDAPRLAAITVDDGHRSVYDLLYPLLRERRLPATVFVYPSAISNADYAMTWDQLREMEGSGLVDVQSHTYWHPNFNTERRRRSADGFRAFVDDQLMRSKATIEKRLGNKVDQLAWPFGIVDADLEAAARRAGYAAALAYEGGPATADSDLLALPRIPIGDADRGAQFAAKIAAPSTAPLK